MCVLVLFCRSSLCYNRYLQKLRQQISIGVVGGSDLVKQMEQLGDSPNLFDYAFPENGLQAFKDGVEIDRTSFLKWIGEEKLQKLINFILVRDIVL